LPDVALKNVDGVLEQAGQEDGAHVEAAIDEERVDLSKPNGLVDDSLLHFQGKDPEKDREDDE
jgi:hypothetical protein